MTLLAKILALLIHTIPIPEASNLSRVPECVADAEAAELERSTGLGYERDVRFDRLWYRGWSRRETEVEAIERYLTAARALEQIHNEPPEGWLGTPWQLVRGLTAIIRHESHLTRSVHEGRLLGAAGEGCLIQAHPAVVGDVTPLLGLQLEATERCLRAGARILSEARRFCDSRGSAWFASSVSLYGTGWRCDPVGEWVAQRFATYRRTRLTRPLPLLAQVRLTLPLDPSREIPVDPVAIALLEPP